MKSTGEFKVGDWVVHEAGEMDPSEDWHYILEIMKRPRQIKGIKKEFELIGTEGVRIDVVFTDGSSGQLRANSYRLATEQEIKAEQLRKLFQ